MFIRILVLLLTQFKNDHEYSIGELRTQNMIIDQANHSYQPVIRTLVVWNILFCQVEDLL